jgi:hypothetical protein
MLKLAFPAALRKKYEYVFASFHCGNEFHRYSAASQNASLLSWSDTPKLQVEVVTCTLGWGFDDYRGDDTKGAAASAEQGPVQVRINTGRCGDEGATGSNDFKSYHLVGTHSGKLHQGAVASAGDISTCNAYGRTDTTDDRHTVLFSGLIDLEHLHSSAELECRALVVIAIIVINELDVFQVVRP